MKFKAIIVKETVYDVDPVNYGFDTQNPSPKEILEMLAIDKAALDDDPLAHGDDDFQVTVRLVS